MPLFKPCKKSLLSVDWARADFETFKKQLLNPRFMFEFEDMAAIAFSRAYMKAVKITENPASTNILNDGIKLRRDIYDFGMQHKHLFDDTLYTAKTLKQIELLHRILSTNDRLMAHKTAFGSLEP